MILGISIVFAAGAFVWLAIFVFRPVKEVSPQRFDIVITATDHRTPVVIDDITLNRPTQCKEQPS